MVKKKLFPGQRGGMATTGSGRVSSLGVGGPVGVVGLRGCSVPGPQRCWWCGPGSGSGWAASLVVWLQSGLCVSFPAWPPSRVRFPGGGWVWFGHARQWVGLSGGSPRPRADRIWWGVGEFGDVFASEARGIWMFGGNVRSWNSEKMFKFIVEKIGLLQGNKVGAKMDNGGPQIMGPRGAHQNQANYWVTPHHGSHGIIRLDPKVVDEKA
jgi:hypothetical protein